MPPPPTLLAHADNAELRDAVKAATGLPDVAVQSLVVELLRFLRLAARHPQLDLSPSPDVDAAWHALLLLPQLYVLVCATAKDSNASSASSSSSAAAAPFVVPHHPARAGDPDAVRRARYEATLAAYEAEYLASAPEAQWPRDYAVGGAASAAAAPASSKRSAAASGFGAGGSAPSAEEEEAGEGGAPPAPKRGKAAPAPQASTVTIKTEDGATFALDVEPADTVLRVKALIAEREGVPTARVRLFHWQQWKEQGLPAQWAARELVEERQPLSHYHIQQGAYCAAAMAVGGGGAGVWAGGLRCPRWDLNRTLSGW
jgi:hypothetical protein